MSLFAELKRRNVIRVAVAYVVASWLLIEASTVALEGFGAPGWVPKAVAVLLALGFPIALIFSWVYEMTPEGLKREADITHDQSITAHTARKLDVAVIVLLVAAIGMFAYDKMTADDPVLAATGMDVVLDAAEQHRQQQAAQDLSIAVLPFVNMSSDPENEYFADGLSEELLNRLAQVPGLRVAGRTSSFQFKGESRDLREIGATLGVAHVLEGSVRRQGDQVRITAQLIQSSDGSHLWSETYDRTLDDVFAIQDQISEQVVAALDIVLDETARQRMLNAGVRNVDAFVAYQRGIEILNVAHGQTDDLVGVLGTGMPYFDAAIEADPGFTSAWLARSDYYAHILFAGGYTQGEYDRALISLRESLDRAYETARDPDRKAIVDVDRVLWSDDWRALRSSMERALEVEGCMFSLWGMEMATYIGYADRTERHWRTQAACEPLTAYLRAELAYTLSSQGRLEEALAVIDEAIAELGADTWTLASRASTLVELGRFEEALETAREVPADTPFFGVLTEVSTLAAAGRTREARDLADGLMDHPSDPSGNLLQILAMVGYRDEANRVAAEYDQRPAGNMILLLQAFQCGCGAPFDLEVAPNFAARLAEANIDWPPPTTIEFPAKDW